MKHDDIKNRIQLAAALGVAPDDVDFEALTAPVMRTMQRAKYIVDAGESCETEDELFDILFAVESAREIAAYDRVVDVILKHGGF